jgi:hypothetical protein
MNRPKKKLTEERRILIAEIIKAIEQEREEESKRDPLKRPEKKKL